MSELKKGELSGEQNGWLSEEDVEKHLKELTSNSIEAKLDEADLQAKTDPTRYTHEEVFSSIRNKW